MINNNIDYIRKMYSIIEVQKY